MPPEDNRFVFDAHCDTATRLVNEPGSDLCRRSEDGHVDVPRMIEGGVGAQVFACWVDPDIPEDRWNHSTLDMIDKLRKTVEACDGISVAPDGSTISSLRRKGEIAAVIGVEGGHAIADKGDALGRLFDSGVRCMTLTWNNSNFIADSCEGPGKWGGLSDFGREVIGEMDRLGMAIDCSHSSDQTFYDVLERSSNPVLVSHSCMRAICDFPRNVTDDMLSALSQNGGVIGINFFPAFLEQECCREVMGIFGVYKKERSRLASEYKGDVARADRELLPKYTRLIEKIRMPGVPVVVDHIEHAIAVAGIDHVGLGSDFDGIAVTPEGLEDISKMPSIAGEMSARGYSEGEIARVTGENMLRFFTEVCG